MAQVWEKGGKGGIDLANKVLETLENKESKFKPLYDTKLPIKEKIETVAKEIYGADGVNYSPEAQKAVKTVKLIHEHAEGKISNVSIITNKSKFEALKHALEGVDIQGMSVTEISGCGVQKGKTEYYRGVPMTLNLLPKLQVDIVVSKVPVSKVIEAAQTSLYTGHIGDGKIFVYDVEQVVRVRTGETGFDALQGDE